MTALALVNSYRDACCAVSCDGSLIDCGIVDGYHFIAVRDAEHDRLMIRCGCRWFTVREAREHWRIGYKRGQRNEIRDALDYAVKVAKPRGWKIGR